MRQTRGEIMVSQNTAEVNARGDSVPSRLLEFQTRWKIYSIFDLDRYELDGRVIYIPHDRTCVFIEHGDETRLGVRCAKEDEIDDLWQKHRLVALLPVYRRMINSPCSEWNGGLIGQFSADSQPVPTAPGSLWRGVP
jgi:hypothetical protein